MMQVPRRWISTGALLFLALVAVSLLQTPSAPSVSNGVVSIDRDMTATEAELVGMHRDSPDAVVVTVKDEPAPTEPTPKIVRYVLVTTQRTGSTMMCTLIDKAPSSACLDEAVLSYQNARNTREDAPTNWSDYLEVLELVLNPFQGAPPADAPAYLRAFVEREQKLSEHWEQDGLRVVGFKLMYNQMFADTERLFSYFEAHNVRVIHLIRRSTLDTYASIVAARQSGVYHSKTGDAVNDVQVDANWEEVVFQLKLRDAERQRVIEHVRAYSLPYLEVYYEDVAGEHSLRDVTSIFRFLSLPADKESVQAAIAGTASHRKPVATLPCKERFRNWDDLRAKLIEKGYAEDVRICEEMVHPQLSG